MRLLLCNMRCDGCGRPPNFVEWVRGEFSQAGYEEWRHPGIVFRAAGVDFTYDTRGKCERLFEALYGHPMPDELSYLCPNCAKLAQEELPALAAADTGDNVRATPRYYAWDP